MEYLYFSVHVHPEADCIRTGVDYMQVRNIVGVVCIVAVCMVMYLVVFVYMFAELFVVVICSHERALPSTPMSVCLTDTLPDLRFCLPLTKCLLVCNLQQHDLIECMGIAVLFVFVCFVHMCFCSYLVFDQGLSVRCVHALWPMVFLCLWARAVLWVCLLLLWADMCILELVCVCVQARAEMRHTEVESRFRA
jgi:hypothetical protein